MFDTPPRETPKHAPPPPPAAPREQELKIELKNPVVAGILAWLIPGAGHFYQQRWAKGTLFCVCILGTYLFGLVVGEGKVVHTGGEANVAGRGWARLIQTWPIIPQSCVGLSAAPAYIQHYRLRQGLPPIWDGLMAPPRSTEELAYWYDRLNVRYDIGWLYTIVAGLLNVLAIYDAACGPVILEEGEKEKENKESKKKKGAKT